MSTPTPPPAAQPPADPTAKAPGPIRWLIRNEPVLVSTTIAAIGVFSTVRWGASKVDLATQLVSGLLPLLIGFIARQFVTPTSKVLTPGQLEQINTRVQELDGLVRGMLHGEAAKVLDILVAAIGAGAAAVVGGPADVPVVDAPVTGGGEAPPAPPSLTDVNNTPSSW